MDCLGKCQRIGWGCLTQMTTSVTKIVGSDLEMFIWQNVYLLASAGAETVRDRILEQWEYWQQSDDVEAESIGLPKGNFLSKMLVI